MKHDISPVSLEFRSVSQLYDSEDPWPENVRALSNRAEERIALAFEGALTGIHPRIVPPIEVRIPLLDHQEERGTAIPSAIRSHFLRRADELDQLKQRTIRVGLREFRLTIAVCLPSFLGIALCSRYDHHPVATVIQNILVIFCWVVIWQPFQSIVFDRWTLSTQAKVYRIIARSDVRLSYV